MTIEGEWGFERFFAKEIFTNYGALVDGLIGALTALQHCDLTTHYADNKAIVPTYPRKGQASIYRISDSLANLTGARRQNLPIYRGLWRRDSFEVNQCDGGLAMQVILQIARWGKEEDMLNATLSATCHHEMSRYFSLQYIMGASLSLDERSMGIVQQRTDGTKRTILSSMLIGNTGKRVSRHPASNEDNDGRHGLNDLTDEI
ncbi:hypothetical protein COT87_00820 [Candidatus Collierbacteria bacterium CG10_big_fil_rev_8_21_14_0_10_44_9]|uniref:Uncharacterized protein n=1 Tax=Candidatus Collierbacteria bacterium CG10_big_fil_rev_8_21_14_0_10_44_9 TaxID=1974535 RepID=A0A2H0VLH8_9BACT|nr:MAG: hypothetical protein COT87_00820 [Candidatus Collierbacteria bacterium CG10_big_fil_rev_8_21_14_0_10_44_9]